MDITDEHLEETFVVNIFAMFRITSAATPFLKEGSCIIKTSSITAYEGIRNYWIILQQREPSLPSPTVWRKISTIKISVNAMALTRSGHR